MKENLEKKLSISQRISQIVDNEGGNLSDVSRRLGYKRSQTLTDYKDGKAKPTFEFFQNFIKSKFSEKYNIDWLITGHGEMLKSDESQLVDNSTKNALNSTVLKSDDEMYSFLIQNNKGTRYFDNYASAGLISGITDGRTRPDAVILVPGLDDCNFAINVYGDSMYPKYCSGEIVMCKEMQIDSQLTYIRFGEAYVVVLDDGTVLKYVQPGADDDHLEFESENSRYKPYQVHKSRIQKMYLVKGVITRKNF